MAAHGPVVPDGPVQLAVAAQFQVLGGQDDPSGIVGRTDDHRSVGRVFGDHGGPGGDRKVAAAEGLPGLLGAAAEAGVNDGHGLLADGVADVGVVGPVDIKGGAVERGEVGSGLDANHAAAAVEVVADGVMGRNAAQRVAVVGVVAGAAALAILASRQNKDIKVGGGQTALQEIRAGDRQRGVAVGRDGPEEGQDFIRLGAGAAEDGDAQPGRRRARRSGLDGKRYQENDGDQKTDETCFHNDSFGECCDVSGERTTR